MLGIGGAMRQFWVTLACLFALLPGVAVGQARFSVGSASAASGEKATGFIEVPAGVDAATMMNLVPRFFNLYD